MAAARGGSASGTTTTAVQIAPVASHSRMCSSCAQAAVATDHGLNPGTCGTGAGGASGASVTSICAMTTERSSSVFCALSCSIWLRTSLIER
jgi:hypothetical protein